MARSSIRWPSPPRTAPGPSRSAWGRAKTAHRRLVGRLPYLTCVPRRLGLSSRFSARRTTRRSTNVRGGNWLESLEAQVRLQKPVVKPVSAARAEMSQLLLTASAGIGWEAGLFEGPAQRQPLLAQPGRPSEAAELPATRAQ